MTRSLLSSPAARAVALVAGIGSLALLLGGAATASVPAAVPSATGAISACYSSTTGALRVVDVARRQRCRGGERAVAWGPTWVWRGGYDARRSYPAGSVVTVAGSSYVARALVPAGRVPGVSSSWGVVAAAGAPGAAGAAGAPGRNGSDMLVLARKLYGEARVTDGGVVEFGGTSQGSLVTAQKVGTGQYNVDFPGFYDPASSSIRANVQLTPFSLGPVACEYGLFSGFPNGTLRVGVRCFNTQTTADTDSYFSIAVTA